LKEAQALNSAARAVRARVTIETAADGSARIAGLEFLPPSKEEIERVKEERDKEERDKKEREQEKRRRAIYAQSFKIAKVPLA